MPRNIIYYFSGTGNSYAVAKQLSLELDHTKAINLLTKNAYKYIKEDTDSIGIVYPIHMNALPRVVKAFVDDSSDHFKGYLYAVATYGGLPGSAGLYLFDVMKKAGCELNAYYEVTMINNTPKGVAPKPLMRLTWEEAITEDLIQQMLVSSKARTKAIADMIHQHKSYFEVDSELLKNRLKKILMAPLWKLSENNPPKLEFLVDESCDGCGKCAKVCTSHRIGMINDRPKWLKDECHYCYACFNVCPLQAIGVEHYTKKLGRYHHPEVDIEMIGRDDV